jgi:hypothetical protein
MQTFCKDHVPAYRGDDVRVTAEGATSCVLAPHHQGSSQSGQTDCLPEVSSLCGAWLFCWGSWQPLRLEHPPQAEEIG